MMARATVPEALHELRNPTSAASQTQALRSLKNEIVGHTQRKELIVRQGVIQPLGGLLESGSRKGGKRKADHGTRREEREGREDKWTEEDEMRLQAILVVGSLAFAGPSLVSPILNGSIVPPLLDALSPSENPSKLIIPTLRTLANIAESLACDSPISESVDATLWMKYTRQIYGRNAVGSLAEILSQKGQSSAVQTQVELVAQLIGKTCTEEEYRNSLVKSGVLDLLASRLSARMQDPAHLRSHGSFTPRAPSLTELLEAIRVIVQGSHYRTAKFIFSQSILSLPSLEGGSARNEFNNQEERQWEETSPDIYENVKLPRLDFLSKRQNQYPLKAFPLSSLNPNGRESSRTPIGEALNQSSFRTAQKEDPEPTIFAWLVAIARKSSALERLQAIWLLTLLKRFCDWLPGDEKQPSVRERKLGLLVIPLLVRMIEAASPSASEVKTGQQASPGVLENKYAVLEQAPYVLGLMLEESPLLQHAAVDAGVIKKLCLLLKQTFGPPPPATGELWSPNPGDEMTVDSSVDPASSTPGRRAYPAAVVYSLRVRVATLKALAAVAEKDDSYRKIIIEHAAVGCVPDSLTPYSDEILTKDPKTLTTSAKEGNPVPVLIAACGLARSISRSVSILRTSLIDYGVAKPILTLLNHQDIRVQIAATEVSCNLLLHFSPLRDVSGQSPTNKQALISQDIMQAGCLKILCEHAHSVNMEMRLNSLWALKHLVLTADNDVKMSCLEQLGTGWLIRALSGDLREISSSHKSASTIGMGTPNAAGEQVDILNAVEEPGMDIDDEDEYMTSEEEFEDAPTEINFKGVQAGSASRTKEYLRKIKDTEQDPGLRAEADELRMQEQALDFIRNLISESKGTGASEMIDHILREIGETRFFDIMEQKLSPKPHRPLKKPAELTLAALYVLVHIANGRPAHRALVISQAALTPHLLELFSHEDKRIRVLLAWLICNLTWMDDSSDALDARQRALQLRNAGFDDAIKRLVHDSDLDTKERAKTAHEQMNKLLNGPGGPGTIGVPGIMSSSHRAWEQ